MINLGKPPMAVGIDVGGTSLKCGLVTEAGEIIYQKEVSLKNALTEQAVILTRYLMGAKAAVRACNRYFARTTYTFKQQEPDEGENKSEFNNILGLKCLGLLDNLKNT